MAIRNLSSKEKVLLAICIILVLVAILYNVIIEPAIMRWRGINTQIDAKLSLLMRNIRLLNMYKIIEAEYTKYHGFVDVSRNEEEELAKTLKEIENLSKESSCHISNVKPRSSKDLGTYKEIFFEVVAEGDIDKLSRFLYEIETSKQYLRVKRFTITSKSGLAGDLKGTFLISKIIVI